MPVGTKYLDTFFTSLQWWNGCSVILAAVWNALDLFSLEELLLTNWYVLNTIAAAYLHACWLFSNLEFLKDNVKMTLA